MPSLTDLVTFRTKKPQPPSSDHSSEYASPAVTHRQSMPAPKSSRPPSTVISTRHYDHLIGELRCPGCTRPLQSPIRLCGTGHSLCAECARRLPACPLCAAPLTTTRSLALEALAARAAFSCVNAPQGCSARLPPVALRTHQQRCVYQMGDCFMGRVWGGCSWLGRELDWLEHCQAAHAERIFETAEQQLSWMCSSYEQRPKPLAAYYMFRVFGETFNLYQVWEAASRRVAWTVICASKDPLVGQRFAFEVELFVPGDERRAHVRRHGCHGERDEDVLVEGKCASFELAEVQRFVDAYRILHYRVRILAIRPVGQSPSSRRAADAVALLASRTVTPPATPADVPAVVPVSSSSTASSIAVVPDDEHDDGDTDALADRRHSSPAASAASAASSFEHVQRVRIGELPTLAKPVFRGGSEFSSPSLVVQAQVNVVPKPPRHSLERGVRAPRAVAESTDDNDDEDEEVRRLLLGADVEVAPLPPTSPMPKSDMSIVFAKSNVN